jgi:hypothetical protein
LKQQGGNYAAVNVDQYGLLLDIVKGSPEPSDAPRAPGRKAMPPASATVRPTPPNAATVWPPLTPWGDPPKAGAPTPPAQPRREDPVIGADDYEAFNDA